MSRQRLSGICLLLSALPAPVAAGNASLLALIPVIRTVPGSAPESSVDDLFKDVFGKQRPSLAAGTYAALVDGINVGDFRIVPAAGGIDGVVEARFVKLVLLPLADPAFAAQLAPLAAAGTDVPFADLRKLGLDVTFDPTNLALVVQFPPAMRSVRDIGLRRANPLDGIILTPQARVSAYVSVRTGTTVLADSERLPTGLYRFASDIDLGFNILGVAAETRLRYDDRRRRKWSRDDIRLTYDDRETLIRYELGDLSIGKRSFQLSPQIMGFAMFRNYNINPYLNIRPNQGQFFELEQDAQVEVLINGFKLREFNLRSGRYNLRDLPLISSGSNDIELHIRYASGTVQTLSFPAFFDIDLLAPGLTDFAINLGIPYADVDGGRNYNNNEYNGIAYIRHGFSPVFTAGLQWEGSRHFDLLGAELIWASPIGTFAANAAINARRWNLGTGQASLQYRWRDANQNRGLSIDALLTLTGSEFRTLNTLMSDTILSRQARVRAGMNLSTQSRVQVFGGYESYRQGLGDLRYAGFNISHQIGSVSLAFEAEYRDGDQDKGLRVRLGLSVPMGRSSITSSYSSEENTARVQFDRLPAIGVNNFGYSIGTERRDGSDRQYARINYIGNRFDAALQQTSRDYMSGAGDRDLRYDLNFGTALVMADGHFGISRPVGNSFAIIDANPRAGKYPLAIEPRIGFGSSETGYSAFSGALGPAVVTPLSPYFHRVLQVDAPTAPPGGSLGGQIFNISPGYRSGYHMRVGSERNVTVIGTLVDRDGDPLPYATLTATIEGKGAATAKSREVFTNGAGRFYLDEAEAGRRYALHVTVDGQAADQVLEVPPEQIGIYRPDKPLMFDLNVKPRE
jgi:outer membrane usher protein